MITIILGVIFYFVLFYLYISITNETLPYEYGFFCFLPFIPYTPFLVETMVRHNFIKSVGKNKWVIIIAEGMDIKNTVMGERFEKHYNWSQIKLVEVIDRTVLLGKFTGIKFYQMRIVFDAEKYLALREQYVWQTVEQYHKAELAACCFDMEYTQAAFEEIKTYCNPEVVHRKRL